MEMEENFDEMFDLNPFDLAEISIFSNGGPKPQNLDAISCISRNSCHHRQETFSKKASELISFENSSNSDHILDYNSNHLEMAKDYSLTSHIINFSSPPKDDISGKKPCHRRVCTALTRTRSQAQDHLMAERKRRQNLSQLFISLSKVVPGLKKLDKASLLEDAINYLKALQERVSALEKGEIKESSIDVDDSALYVERSMNNNGSTRESASPEISVRIAKRHVLVKICCKKQMDLMSRIPCELEKLHLSVIDMRIMPFGGAALDVTILAEMQSEFGGTVKEIVDNLQAIFLNPSAKFGKLP